MHKSNVPQDRFKDITYRKLFCDVRPNKVDPNMTRLTVGGYIINYPVNYGMPTADMLLVKMLAKIEIPKIGSKFMTGDIKKVYPNTTLKLYEYVRLRL